jgi:phage tail sheath protein FI
MISMPGIIQSDLVDKLITQTQDRGDALAIVDVDGIYRPTWDANGTEVAASITLATTWNDEANSAQLLASSYAATYFPNVRMVDTLNGSRKRLQAPPSVAGIGGIAQSEAASQPWFAPAGFNRGGLNRLGGANGPIVVGTSTHLTRDNRDTLYAQSINPIARFPSTGDTVIFGQKTMMGGTSALNRINVRRLMVYLKRQIGVIADTILFDQNVEVTWNRFKARAEEVLSDVKSELGVTYYKIILDSTTTTPEAIDRNVMYAQIMVKPARAIEYIVVDFIITRSGVEF